MGSAGKRRLQVQYSVVGKSSLSYLMYYLHLRYSSRWGGLCLCPVNVLIDRIKVLNLWVFRAFGILLQSSRFACQISDNERLLLRNLMGSQNVIILDNTQDIVISAPGFLFCGHILMKVRNHVSLGLELTC